MPAYLYLPTFLTASLPTYLYIPTVPACLHRLSSVCASPSARDAVRLPQLHSSDQVFGYINGLYESWVGAAQVRGNHAGCRQTDIPDTHHHLALHDMAVYLHLPCACYHHAVYIMPLFLQALF